VCCDWYELNTTLDQLTHQRNHNLARPVIVVVIHTIYRFIDAICDTPLMKEAHSFLRDKGKAPGPINDFKKLLYKLWFKLYRRTKGDR